MEHLRIVIHLALAQTSFRGACVYRFDGNSDEADLIASVGIPLSDPENRCVLWEHHDRNTPVVLDVAAWRDSRFTALPEFRTHQFEAVISVPLLDSGTIIGLVNFCRKEAGALKLREVAVLISLGLPLAALIASPSLPGQPARAEPRAAAWCSSLALPV
jgi:hypothetical protein